MSDDVSDPDNCEVKSLVLLFKAKQLKLFVILRLMTGVCNNMINAASVKK